MEVQRDKNDAEREISNAIVSIDEALTTLRQYIPVKESAAYVWDRQMQKLRLALGCCRNVHKALTTRPEFKSLRGAAR